MWERRELLPELQKLAEVVFVDVRKVRRGGPSTGTEFLDPELLLPLLEKAAPGEFDASVVYLHSGLVSDQLLAQVRRQTSGPMIGMNLDDKTTYCTYSVYSRAATNYQKWAGKFDCNITNSRSLVDVYRDDGYPCLYLPTGFHFDPAVHKFSPPEAFQWELSFVGSCKHERKMLVEDLQSRGVTVNTFGGGWPGATFTDSGVSAFRNSMINLGIGYNIPGKQITNLKNRDFECPGSGGCYLTTFDWELAELFDVGREILCYRDVDDLVEIFSWYRRRPEKCRAIARAGFERAKNEHTWAHRFQKVLSGLGLKSEIR